MTINRPQALPRWIKPAMLAVGALDTVTGLLLLAMPLITLRLMGVSQPPAEPVLVRFIGAFVTAVGASYFLPWISHRGPLGGDRARLLAVLDVTTLVRLSVGLFVAAAVLRGALAAAWSTVAIADLTIATVQIVVRRRLFSSSPGTESAGNHG
jgi:hypothetical protein